jgi:hypothetical protein
VSIPRAPSKLVPNEQDGMKSPCAVNLHNAVTVSQQRLGKRVAQRNPVRMNKACATLLFSLGRDSTRCWKRSLSSVSKQLAKVGHQPLALSVL